jgi:hypothetical protein
MKIATTIAIAAFQHDEDRQLVLIGEHGEYRYAGATYFALRTASHRDTRAVKGVPILRKEGRRLDREE